VASVRSMLLTAPRHASTVLKLRPCVCLVCHSRGSTEAAGLIEPVFARRLLSTCHIHYEIQAQALTFYTFLLIIVKYISFLILTPCNGTEMAYYVLMCR